MVCGGVKPNTKQCWRYNIKTNDWTGTVPTNYYHTRTPAAVYNNKVYYLNTGSNSEIFDPIKKTWINWKSAPKDQGAHPCMVTWRDSFIVIGGSDNLSGVQMYNITSDSWKTLRANPLGERMGHSCIQMPNSKDKYLVVGKTSHDHRDSAIYDASTDSWRRVADTKFSSMHSSLTALGNRVFVMGGRANLRVMQDTVEEYLVDKDVWEVKSVRLPVKAIASAALSVPATWFDNKNLNKPLANGCKGVV